MEIAISSSRRGMEMAKGGDDRLVYPIAEE
jgi:hypothetical protein